MSFGEVITSWPVVVVLLLVGLLTKARATRLRRMGPMHRRAAFGVTAVAVGVVLAAIGYAVYLRSLWMGALGAVVLILVVLPRRGAVSADAVAAGIDSELASGRLWLLHLAVNSDGSLLVFRSGGRQLPYKAFRLIGCPHCFVEKYLSSLLDGSTADDAVEHYRANIADGQPVEVHLKRSDDGVGGLWELNYHYPLKATWRVVFPATCAVHKPVPRPIG